MSITPSPSKTERAGGRRGFLLGLSASLVLAPSIVRAGSLMPISAPVVDLMQFYGGLYVGGGPDGQWYVRAERGYQPFDLLDFFQNTRFRPTGPITKRVRVISMLDRATP